MKISPRVLILAALPLLGAEMATAQLRIAQWNVTNYRGGRFPEFQTSIYGEFSGRSMRPDILAVQEFYTSAGHADFLTMLNTAPNSPGDWAAAPWIAPGADSTTAFYYRTSKIDFLGVTRYRTSNGNTSEPPRDLMRYDVRLKGFNSPKTVLAIYNNHFKSSTGSANEARRLKEAQYYRTNAESLDPDWNVLMCADLNIQDSGQAAYVELTGSKTNNLGRLFDPINTPGNWENTSAFRIVHTQEPSTQMDSRHDQILLEGSFYDGGGLEYIGNRNIPYSTTTWDDPNHSYRCWGNDGTTFDTVMKTTGNTMVGPTIASALITTVNGNGHLPVFLDVKVPASAAVPDLEVDFGLIDQGASAIAPVSIVHSGNVGLWNLAGISNLNYTISATGGVTPPGGVLVATPGQLRTHTLSLNTSTPGIRSGTITFTTDAPDQPSIMIPWRAVVVPKITLNPPKVRKPKG